MNPNASPPWMRSMRRQDREIIDKKRMWEIIRSGEVCRLAFCWDGWPYIVPMSFGTLNEALYFHCASTGTKLDLLKANPNVCFEIEANVHVVPGDRACAWSVRYQSVIGFGRASVVEDPQERHAGIRALLTHYADLLSVRHADGGQTIPEQISPETVVLRVDVHSLKGKESTRQ